MVSQAPSAPVLTLFYLLLLLRSQTKSIIDRGICRHILGEVCCYQRILLVTITTNCSPKLKESESNVGDRSVARLFVFRRAAAADATQAVSACLKAERRLRRRGRGI